MFRHTAYLIETLTNTHVGSGDTTLGIVDNEIQKDPVTSLPVFHPSSIKGAVRDHFEGLKDEDNFQEKGSGKIKPFTFNAVFGAQQPDDIAELKKDLEKSGMSEEEIKKADQKLTLLKKAPAHGLVKFHEARLLTLPLRSSTRVFHNGLCPSSALDYLDSLDQFQVENGIDPKDLEMLRNLFLRTAERLDEAKNKDFIVFGKNGIVEPMVEDFENVLIMGINPENEKRIARYFSPHNMSSMAGTLAVFRDDIFKLICESGLPVIARNSLNENGISQNLFYEEVLPRRAVLWFITGTHKVFSPNEEDYFNKCFRFFEDTLVKQNIQMGANASVGYGMTSISRIGG